MRAAILNQARAPLNAQVEHFPKLEALETCKGIDDVRNRVARCRCGAAASAPFSDSSPIFMGRSDH